MYDRVDMIGGMVLFMPGWFDRNPRYMAMEMTSADMEKILTTCDGDFDRLEDATAQAVSLCAAKLGEKREERNKRAQEAYKVRSARFHEIIIDEIVNLMEGSGGFRTCDIQLAAVKRGNGFPVRTRQMYAAHIDKEAREDGRITHVSTGGVSVTVIYKDRRSGTQGIPYHGMWRVK